MRFLKVPTVRVVKENDKGQPEEIEILDPDGKVLERETYVYDEHGMQKRNTFDAEGKLLAYEVWTREPDGKLAQHELHQGDGKPIYIEKWTRDADGKLLHAEHEEYEAKDDAEQRVRKRCVAFWNHDPPQFWWLRILLGFPRTPKVVLRETAHQ